MNKRVKSLHEDIFDVIDDHDTLTCSTVARLIGSTKQNLDQFKSDGTIGFRYLLRLSFVLYPDSQKEVMSDWCLRLNTTESIKQSFEYASITRNKDLLKKLIDIHRNETGVISKYVSVYSILYRYYNFEISANDLIDELKKVKNLKNELGILRDIMKCYTYYYQEKYHVMLQTAQDICESINDLGDRYLFIKECYLHRIAEILECVALFLNDKKTARHYAWIIINADICAKTVSDAYYILGMSFLTEDKHKCITYLQTRYDITKELEEAELENYARRDLDLVKLYFGIKLDEDADPVLVKFQNSVENEFELKQIMDNAVKDGDDDLLVLISVMRNGSIQKLYKCHKHFFSKSNYYFASLAAVEVKKRGETSPLIDELINFKIESKGDVEFEEYYIKCFNRVIFANRNVSAS